MNEKDMDVIEAMEKYGGSFVKALAVCFRRADAHNLVKLKHAFPDYYNQYAEMSELKK